MILTILIIFATQVLGFGGDGDVKSRCSYGDPSLQSFKSLCELYYDITDAIVFYFIGFLVMVMFIGILSLYNGSGDRTRIEIQ